MSLSRELTNKTHDLNVNLYHKLFIKSHNLMMRYFYRVVLNECVILMYDLTITILLSIRKNKLVLIDRRHSVIKKMVTVTETDTDTTLASLSRGNCGYGEAHTEVFSRYGRIRFFFSHKISNVNEFMFVYY